MRPLLVTLAMVAIAACGDAPEVPRASTHAELVSLFEDWRAFEAPTLIDGVPDFSAATMSAKRDQIPYWKARLAAVDTSGWSVSDRVDYELIRAEINGFDFDLRLRKPWERDPSFYVMVYTSQSDVPAREGPVIHTVIESWQYDTPLSDEAAAELATRLRTIAPLYEAAKENLTGNARDLWVAGVRTIGEQLGRLDVLTERVNNPEVAAAADEAAVAIREFQSWLDASADAKTGSSGLGKEAYTWYLQNVHLMPYTWEEEVTIMKRELARSHAYMKLFEHRNRALAPLNKMDDPVTYERVMNQAVTEYLAFIDEAEIHDVAPWMDVALREKINPYTEEAGLRSFFQEVDYREPLLMRSHHNHWIDIARIREDPHESAIRNTPLLYNIFDGRAEGMATGMEEMMWAAGLLEGRPHAEELVFVMLGQRAARALGGLYMHANEMTMQEAAEFAVEWTPRGWMAPDGWLVAFEQHLYLQQPGYGSSYITGKVVIEDMIREVAHIQGDTFTLKGFFNAFNDAGVIPLSLIRWEMTGDDSVYRETLEAW